MNKEKPQQPEAAKPEKANPENHSVGQDYLKVQKEFAEYKDKYVRLYAEFENARKRYERERIEFVKYANEDLIQEFLGILDDLERSVEAAKVKHQDYDAFLKGIEMVMGRVQELLKKNDVQRIKSVGEKFDPHRHEILMLVDSDEHGEGVILEEFQKGYLLGDKVVRTAKVKVAKSKPPDSLLEQSSAEKPEEQPPPK